jgi:hypothetical protein
LFTKQVGDFATVTCKTVFFFGVANIIDSFPHNLVVIQVSCVYQDGRVVGVDAVVLSTHHDGDISQATLKEAVMEEIIKPELTVK